MYLPPHFREERSQVLAQALAAHPLGLLIRNGSAGLTADPLPFLLSGEAAAGGRLLAHVARANPIVGDLAEGTEVLVVFQGPQGYLSPSWYATKAETHRVVPTWNYVTVQVRGRARLVDDPAFTRGVVARLTATQEAERPVPWTIDDAPEAYVAGQLRGIVGLEIEIAAIEGKWKVSQNRNAADRAGAARGFAAEGHAAMAELVAPTGAGDPEKIG